MDLVQNFQDDVKKNWYQPGNDHDTWLDFYDRCWKDPYKDKTADDLKRIAWNCRNISSGADSGMWEDRSAKLTKFLHSSITLYDSEPDIRDDIQYEFIACFLNPYSHAAHNNDLWQTFNDAAKKILTVAPSDATALQARFASREKYLPRVFNPKWLLPVIASLIYNAFRQVNLSFYRPTEDAGTWNLFFSITFEYSAIGQVNFTMKIALALSGISSGPDEGVWAGLNALANKFIDNHLGKEANDFQSQITLATDFCKMFQFNYTHAAHNKDLFKAYNDAFTAAAKKIALIRPV